MTTQPLDAVLDGRRMLFLGCGNMGFALLSGVIDHDIPLTALSVIDPAPGGHLRALAHAGLSLNPDPTEEDPPAVCLIAVKPQALDAALPAVRGLAEAGTLFLSVAAGVPLARYAALLGAETPVVRAMPNTPAAIGAGVTALIANDSCRPSERWLAEALMQTVGDAVWLDDEAAMDAVTAVSGSGPAYVFLLIEALAAAGVAEGLPKDLALRLALGTVGGAARLAEDGSETPAELRRAVTSPGGTTAAALEVLMDDTAGLPPLLRRAVAAAAARSRELGA